MPPTRKSPVSKGVKYDFTKKPMDLNEFLKNHKEELKDKDIIYAIRSNHKQDRRNVKVGKAEKGADRLKQHQNTLGIKTAEDPTAGAQLLYVEVVPKRGAGVQGQRLLNAKENQLKADLRKASATGSAVAGRGSEVFDVSVTSLRKALDKNQNVQTTYKPVRQSERIRRCVKWETIKT